MRYRNVLTRIWRDRKFRKLSPDAKLFFLQLLTSPNSQLIPGVILDRVDTVSALCGYSVERGNQALRELEKAGVLLYDPEAWLFWLPNGPKLNPPPNPSVVKGWNTLWTDLPESPLLPVIYSALRECVSGLSGPFQKALGDRVDTVSALCGGPCRQQDQDQDQDQEEEEVPKNELLKPHTDSAGENVLPFVSPDGPTPSAIGKLWNEICSPKGFPSVRKVTEKRKRKIKTRCSEERRPLSWWEAYFEKIASTPFLAGENQRGWVADFDFAIESEDNVLKVFEGKYDARKQNPKADRQSSGVVHPPKIYKPAEERN